MSTSLPREEDPTPGSPAGGPSEQDVGIRVVARGQGLFTAFDRSLLHNRDLVLSLIRRDVALRYKQTVLGPAWVLLQPLLGAGVFTFLFTTVADVPLPDGVPYFVFALVGLAMWTGFSQALNRSTSSLLSNKELVSKIYFPRFLLPLSAAASALVDAAVLITVALGAALVSGAPVGGKSVVAVPVVLLCVAFALSLGTALSCLLVRFRDVSYGLPVLTQALLFVTPILYPVESVPDSARPFVEANPLTFLFEALRWAVFDSAAPSGALAAYSLSVFAATTVLAGVIFSQFERDLADVI